MLELSNEDKSVLKHIIVIPYLNVIIMMIFLIYNLRRIEEVENGDS